MTDITLNFGLGPHECLSKYAGMEMIPEMVRQVILLKDLHAPESIDYKNGPFPESYLLQGYLGIIKQGFE